MTEGELRSAPGRYVHYAWVELNREGSPFDYMREEPCVKLLQDIDKKITQLVNLLNQGKGDPPSSDQKT